MRYVLETENSSAGASVNPAQTVFHVDQSFGPSTDAEVAAQLIAFAQYMLPAGGTSVSRVMKGTDPPGPTLPVAFPVAEYANLVSTDANLDAMTAYGVQYGAFALTARGVGAVMTKRSLTPGRTGMGRLTTPWLPVTWVDGNGQLAAGGGAIVIQGFESYLRGIVGAIPGQVNVIDLLPYIWPAMANIVTESVSNNLGRLRSRKG